MLTGRRGTGPERQSYGQLRHGFCAGPLAHVPTAGPIAASDNVRQGPGSPTERMEGELMTMLDALIDPYFDHAEA